MIDPDRLPAHAVTGDIQRTESVRECVAAFLNALLADDEAMERGADQTVLADLRPELARKAMRIALTAAVQEDQ